MRSLNRSLFAMLALTLCVCASVIAADKVPNPQYQAWEKYKPGTRVHYTQVTEAMGVKSEGEMIQTLISLTKEKGVVEIKMNMTTEGEKVDTPVQKLEFFAKVTPDAVQMPGQPQGMPVSDLRSGQDEIVVKGKTYDCKWTEFTTEQSGLKVKTKSWLADGVPGKLIKMEATTTGAVASTTVITLANIEEKKK